MLYIRNMINTINSTDRLIFDLEMLQIDYNEQKIASLKKEIANKYNVPLKNVEINFKPITINLNGDKISLASDIISNTQDASFQKSVMKDYLKLREINDVDWDNIDIIDNQVNTFIDFDQYSKYKNYKFKYVKWSNYLSYGPDNYFDFTKLHGLVLLNSDPANQGGKTTFAIDLLRFALFGKAEKSPTLDSVFNGFIPEATEVVVEACIEIDGVDYVIRRTVTRPALKKRTAKSKCKQQLEYFRCAGNELELIENCEAESTQQTNNIIKEAVGNVEDFNLVISATQYSLGDLLRMGATDKGRLFSRWLGLQTIEKKEEIAKKLWKENYQSKLLSNKYNIATLKDEINDYNTCITEYNKLIVEANSDRDVTVKNIEKYNQEKLEIMSSIKPIMDGLDKIDVATVKSNKTFNEQELANKRAVFGNLKDEYVKVKDATYDQADMDALNAERKSYDDKANNLKVSNAEIKTKIGFFRNEIDRIVKLMEEGVCPTCHQVIDVFEQTKMKEDYENKINELITCGVENKKQIDDCCNHIIDLDKSIEGLNKQKNDVDTKSRLELKLTAIKANIENLKTQIESANTTLENIKTNEENIKYNNEIRLKINTIDTSIANENKIRDSKTNDIAKYNTTIENYNKEIEIRNTLITKLNDEEKLIRNWNVYQELVGKNGIIKLVLAKALPIVNNEVSRILNGLCDFEVKLDIDDKNNVIVNLLKDGVVFDMGVSGSGFEGTMASLALRSALASISSMSKPNFIVFDEVLSAVSEKNMENIHEIFKRIITNYDFVLHITHNETIADWHDGGIITVTKVNNISKIK